jgi:putative transposase
MLLQPRIHLLGVPVHLIQLGHNRDACFFAEEDFQVYRNWLADALIKRRYCGAILQAPWIS